jgi:hypothetical protein
MDEKETTGERTLPVALRFEASPELQRSFDKLLRPEYRQLGASALCFYVAGNHKLPVSFNGVDKDGEIGSAKQVTERYNRLLSKNLNGITPYHRQFPVAGIEHFSSQDGAQVDFRIRLRTTSQEMTRLRRKPFDAHIGHDLILPHHLLQTEMQPLPERAVAYVALRQALSTGRLHATHPTAIILPLEHDQHAKD